jgi:hypothetical protein
MKRSSPDDHAAQRIGTPHELVVAIYASSAHGADGDLRILLVDEGGNEIGESGETQTPTAQELREFFERIQPSDEEAREAGELLQKIEDMEWGDLLPSHLIRRQ